MKYVIFIDDDLIKCLSFNQKSIANTTTAPLSLPDKCFIFQNRPCSWFTLPSGINGMCVRSGQERRTPHVSCTHHRRCHRAIREPCRRFYCSKARLLHARSRAHSLTHSHIHAYIYPCL